MSGKSDEAMRTIGEVAASLDLPAHVLRFWETRFKQINPLKRAGGRRFYRQRDIELVIAIRRLLYDEGYTIKGVQRILKEDGLEAVLAGAGRRQAEPRAAETPAPVAASGDAREIIAPFARDPDVAGLKTQSAAPIVQIDAPLPPQIDAGPRPLAEREARLLREVLAEIDECKRLLKLTMR